MKKITAYVLICTLLLCLFPTGILASGDQPDGTPITDADGLAAMISGQNYYLANDITVSGKWVGADFSGVLNGNGKTIWLDGATLEGGLFRSLDNAVIKDLTIEEKSAVRFEFGQGLDGYGTLAAFAMGETTIENVKVIVNAVNMNNFGDGLNFGGIIGMAKWGTVTLNRCVYAGVIGHKDYGYLFYVGGMVGSTWKDLDLTIRECVTYGEYTGITYAAGMVGCLAQAEDGGSLVGVTKNVRLIRNVNYANVHALSGENAAGIIAYRAAPPDGLTEIVGNINYGAISADASNGKVGGIGGNFKQFELPATDSAISGNVNLGELKAVEVAPIYCNYYGSTVIPTSENNLTVAMTENSGGSVPAKGATRTFSDAAVAAAELNAVYPDTYVAVNGEIRLKWASDAGYTKGSVAVKEVDSGSGLSGEPKLDVTVPEPSGIEIRTARELANIKSNGTYYLGCDILISGDWPSPENFSGVLHGNGHSVVFNDAVVKGGLFANLAGGKIYNLTITEATGELAKPNQFKIAIDDASNALIGGVAGGGYGTIVGVTVNCVLGKGMENLGIGGSGEMAVGGIIGLASGGDLTVYNCRNLANVSGATAGGIVGVAGNSGQMLAISQCVNYGEVLSGGASGGILGSHFALSQILYIQGCVNYGSITTLKGECNGGIQGYQKNTPGGVFFLLRNMNFGTVTCNSTTGGTVAWGKPGGILGNLNTAGLSKATVSGNINYGGIVGNSQPNQIVANVYNGGTVVAENNYASGSDIPATVDSTLAKTVGVDTAAELNRVYGELFAVQGEKTVLKWMADAGLTEALPTLTYTVDLTQERINWDEEESTDPLPTDTDEPSTKPEDVTESDPASDTSAEPNLPATGTDKAQEEPAGGCSSSVGLSLAGMVLAAIGAAFVTSRHKH